MVDVDKKFPTHLDRPKFRELNHPLARAMVVPAWAPVHREYRDGGLVQDKLVLKVLIPFIETKHASPALHLTAL